jgi:hypothetical protein
MEPVKMTMEPEKIPDALAALAGDKTLRKTFLADLSVATDAAEGQERDECHPTLEWYQDAATSTFMANLHLHY